MSELVNLKKAKQIECWSALKIMGDYELRLVYSDSLINALKNVSFTIFQWQLIYKSNKPSDFLH